MGDFQKLVARMKRFAESAPVLPPLHTGGARCQFCGAAATCYGAYEGDRPQDYSCDECCGHGCEDGHCVAVPEPTERRERR